MTAYVESFKIANTIYGICKDDDGTFNCWVGGCGIGMRKKTMQEARELIHGYAVERMQRHTAHLAAELEKHEEVLAKLGDDPFNLGRFLQ